MITVKTNAGNAGNAVVKIFKKDDPEETPVWSYHIWGTDPDMIQTGENTNHPSGLSIVFMDRNLGATDNQLNLASHGLYYQWGRKDPFPGDIPGTAGYAAFDSFEGIYDTYDTEFFQLESENLEKAIIETVRHPNRFYQGVDYTTMQYDWSNPRYLWNVEKTWDNYKNKKTIYDPCPDGWRIPVDGEDEYSPWDGLGKLAWIGEYWEEICGATSDSGLKFPNTGIRDYWDSEYTYGNRSCFLQSCRGGFYHGCFYYETHDKDNGRVQEENKGPERGCPNSCTRQGSRQGGRSQGRSDRTPAEAWWWIGA
jgi:hypothetical protein